MHIVEALEAATIGENSTGTNIYERVLCAEEVVRAAGYRPGLTVLSPADALALRLLLQEDGDHCAFAVTLPPVVVSPSVEDGAGFVADPGAIGTLFLSSLTFAAFEENAGASNSSTTRLESHGVFVVQRAGAACYLQPLGS